MGVKSEPCTWCGGEMRSDESGWAVCMGCEWFQPVSSRRNDYKVRLDAAAPELLSALDRAINSIAVAWGERQESEEFLDEVKALVARVRGEP